MNQDDDEIWNCALANRNVSRLLVQAVAARWDWFYHWPLAVTWNRTFDFLSQIIPVVGPLLLAFPATENFPSTRNHAVASMVRVVLGPGHWFTRTVTQGRQGLVTDDPHQPAQNLTAESNAFELANRNQYGTHFGRIHTNQFRLAHRLPTDESIVRTFVTLPIATLTNNGVVHTLRQVAKHWHNMLVVQEEWGNFAHQRMEQLDPFETLRIHVPAVLLTLASLRGRNVWDARVLGPLMQELTNLHEEETTYKAHALVQTLRQHDFVHSVCGGIPTVVDPLQRWLQMIELALERIEEEARQVFDIVSSVEQGIRLGYDVMTQSCWRVPSHAVLVRSVHQHILDMKNTDCSAPIDRRIASALERTTPRDKRTLIELIHTNLTNTKPAQLLLARVTTLLQREIRRDILNNALRDLSKGKYVSSLREDDWYWLEFKKQTDLFSYCGCSSGGHKLQFRHVASGTVKLVPESRSRKINALAYIPVPEAICRAQKALMNIEIHHGKRFSYNAFTEFRFLRVALRRLLVVGQMACETLDGSSQYVERNSAFDVLRRGAPERCRSWRCAGWYDDVFALYRKLLGQWWGNEVIRSSRFVRNGRIDIREGTNCPTGCAMDRNHAVSSWHWVRGCMDSRIGGNRCSTW